MELNLKDKNELLRAALKCTDPGISHWLVAVVDAFEDRPDSKRNLDCPPYVAPATARPAPTGNGHPAQQWEDVTLG